MLISQIFYISAIYFLQIRKWLIWFILHTLLFPAGLIFFIRVVGGGADTVRLAAGATVLSIATVSINATCYWIMTDRFERRLALIKSLPIQLYAYYFAIAIVSMVQSLINVHALIGVMHFCGLGIRYSWVIIPVTMSTSLFFSLIGIFIGTTVKDTNHGTFMMNLLSTGAVFICPLFYPSSVLPAIFVRIVSVTPYMLAFNNFRSIY